jgi:AcrR family transcriptional regulator
MPRYAQALESSPVKKSARGRPRSAATEQIILSSAYSIMAAEGLAAATIDAIARHSKASKMTIYKWWPSREALLIDAFMNKATAILGMPDGRDAASRLEDHAANYVEALVGDFGKVQLAVVAECISNTGSAALFSERYLNPRREIIMQVIRTGQADGSITADAAPADLYDRIYGTLFYRYVFGFGPLTAQCARRLVNSVLGTRP